MHRLYRSFLILLPQVSYEYKLVQMYLAWGAFLLFLLADVAAGRAEIPAWATHVMLFSCAVIFVPLTSLLVVTRGSHIFIFAAQVKTIFLVLILLTASSGPNAQFALRRSADSPRRF